jgi:Domain of unknown function (DUF4296)
MSYLKFILLVSSIVFVASCSRKEDKFPIPKDKLYQVLCDVHLSEASVESESLKMKDSVTKVYYEQIFQKHGITAEDFDSSMSMMSNDPVLMNKIYKEVVKQLSERQIIETPKK